MLGDGGIEGQQCDRAQEQLKIGVALSGENVVCYNSHFWGKRTLASGLLSLFRLNMVLL